MYAIRRLKKKIDACVGAVALSDVEGGRLMETTLNQERFSDYYGLANRMIEVCGKDTLADVARLLAVHIAHYQAKFGKLSMEETVRLLHSHTLTDVEVGTAADGMECLVNVLAVAARLVDEGTP